MGLSNFACPAKGVLPVIVMNIVVSMVLLKNMVRSLLELVVAGASSNSGDELPNERFQGSRGRRVSITRYGSLCKKRCKDIARSSSGINVNGGNMWAVLECCVCLCRFEAHEEVSEFLASMSSTRVVCKSKLVVLFVAQSCNCKWPRPET